MIFNMPPFALRKAAFCVVKGKLLQAERWHIGKWLTISTIRGGMKPSRRRARHMPPTGSNERPGSRHARRKMRPDNAFIAK